MTVRGCLFVLLASVAYAAHAVEFDERLVAPLAASGTELKTRFEGIAIKAGSSDAQSRVAAVRDRAVARERFDARWLLGRLVDTRKPLPELEAAGFTALEDGSYSIDTTRHLEWRPLNQSLLTLTDANFVDSIAPLLIARGFRPADIDVVRQYVSEHDLKRARDESRLAITLAAGKMARKRQQLKLPVDDRFMWSYVYQRARNADEVERRWAEGLLNSLDPQSQRVLASFFAEGDGTLLVSPTNDAEALARERELLLRPDLEQLARTAFEEGKL
jgi:hypothetical protein